MNADKPIRVYAVGVYDLFHYGHAQQLEQCKKLFPKVELVVGVCGDEDTKKYKGLPVMNEQERALNVKHCKWVDEVICLCPWIFDLEFLDKHRIDYAAHDDIPYTIDGIEDVYAPVKKAGRFKATQRTEGISTSDLIFRIVKDRDFYIERNLNRGDTSKELEVTPLEYFIRFAKKPCRTWFRKPRTQQIKGKTSIDNRIHMVFFSLLYKQSKIAKGQVVFTHSLPTQYLNDI